MDFSQPVTELITRRYSCRTYQARPIDEDKRRLLSACIEALPAGPFGAPVRFTLLAASERDRSDLRGLGTYGMVQNTQGFIAGAMGKAEKNLEEFGYCMECLTLYATSLGLGTCWLGGNYTRGSFARKMNLQRGETVPAVVVVGHCEEKPNKRDEMIRRGAGSISRLPWDKLFFEARFDAPLGQEKAGQYASPLEMVRLAPSASNKQPWRVVRDGSAWHFYMQRTPGYRDKWYMRLLGIADLQRADMGIAMCHFELTARQAGLPGGWQVQEPDIQKPDSMTEYVVTWSA